MEVYILSIALVTISLYSCKGDQEQTGGEFSVTVRLPAEPDMLNPARSSSGYATQIESNIYYPLAEIDPFDYELAPLLIKKLAEQEPITSGPDSGGAHFRYRMREEATWEDGTPVTGEDYAFTVKMVLNPKVDVEVWRGYLGFIKDVVVDPEDPKAFTVTVSQQYILADVITCNFNIYPRHIYDPDGLLNAFTVRNFSAPSENDTTIFNAPELARFAEQFMQPRFANEIITGSGPYRLVAWETGQRITLERKSRWWGDKVSDKPKLLNAYPDRIIYEIVPDENTALTMMKDGTIDVLSEVSPRSFQDLRSDSAYAGKLNFFTPKLLVYYYLDLNNRKPALRDVRVRKAIAHVVNYDGIIENVALGMASRTIGPFHPDLEYYNREIKPVAFDLDKARGLLKEAGWSDTDNNGVLDKVVSGNREELEFNITCTQRPEGQAVATLVQESAAKVGIKIDLVIRDGAGWHQDVRNRQFDILPSRLSSPITLSDPFQTWHSSNDAPGGGNNSGFRNAEADSLITVIRTTSDINQRNTAYLALQEILAEEQPVIFLYNPLERIIANSRISLQPSARRPGYFESLFQPANELPGAVKG